MNIQIAPENTYAMVAYTMKRLESAFQAPYPIETVSHGSIARGRKVDYDNYTYGVSYGGKITFGEKIDPHITAVTAAVPS